MNGQVEVTRRTLRTIAQSPMVHAKVPEACIHFALMYTTYHIFMVLPIKDLINKDRDPTMPFKLATGKKPQYHICACYLSMCCTESYCTRWDKGIKYASPSTKRFLWYLRWNSTASKMISCVHTKFKEDNIFI